jgi:hypothetical protein
MIVDFGVPSPLHGVGHVVITDYIIKDYNKVAANGDCT